jgi:hypothetical protein
LETKIVISYKNEKEAEVVAKAVSPDNIKIPSGLFIKTTTDGSKVLTKVECRTGLRTLISTLDDLLACISVAEKTFKLVKK